ncbi:MAG: hypothetical protein R2764_19905 [Bacteroidales bacterium]
MRPVLIILLFLSPVWLFSQAHYTFMYEQGFSAHSGAENLISANYIYGTIDKNYIPVNIFKEKKTIGKIGNIAYRLVKYWYIDYQLSIWGGFVQHEYFGHTARAEQAGFYDAYPVIGIPYFLYRSPKTTLGEHYRPYTTNERRIIYAGGSEANFILAKDILNKTLLGNKVLYQQSIFYLRNKLNLLYPIILVDDVDNIADIRGYNYGIDYNGDKAEVNRQIKTLAWLDLIIDPMNYVSVYSIFKNYIYEGKHETKIPMFRIGNKFRYLPDFRFLLAPYSPELMYENYIRFDKKLLYINIRHAALTIHNSFGISAKLFNYNVSRFFIFDTQISYWDQPKFIIHTESTNEQVTLNEKGYGWAFINTVHYRFIDKFNLSLTAEAGYKTGGYLEGEMLKSGLILRGGFSFNFEK